MSQISKNKAFTLIEVVASLMVFSIGASISLGIFNFNATNRRFLEERFEAQTIALNILRSFSLQQQTGSKLNTGGSSWDYYIGHPKYASGNSSVYPIDGTTWRYDSKSSSASGNWASIPVFTGASSLNLKIESVTAANDKYKYYPDTSSDNSIYEYNYFLRDIQDVVKIVRHKKNWDEISSPSPESIDPLNYYLLTVAVSWPKNVQYECDRKRTVVSTVVSQ